ncbi:ABC transporter ATP-binding protein [Jannaschia sp. M317]|uniref:ABC transporter ATP-binding protein n=1 Tax=Jannaschia sp. M317 TaxID=2867011 RepID=UPI0021A51F7C|nr:ABC transporter ATP-binding protein [Jannaschia sp. M317]UWQ19926.1 ABC transporter ATP-binding protein [Jannaschia sp. M317]
MSENILTVRNLDMGFPTGGGFFGKPTGIVRAVDDVSFTVKRGETFGVVGESGSGKTTLGRCIMRILEPSGGSIQFEREDGNAIELVDGDKAKLQTFWRDVRMVFQDPQSSLNPRLPIIEIVGQALRKSGTPNDQIADTVRDLLAKVGLRPEMLHRYPGAFSGGQRQRIGIARALATNPDLVIADEAVSALDVSIQAQTLNLLQDLQEAFDLTYVFIAHDLAVVEHIADRVAVMYLGQIVELADCDTLFADPRHPYTRALLSAVPVADPRKRKPRGSVPKGEISWTNRGCKFASRCPHATDLCRETRPPVKQVGGADVLCHYAGEV